MTKPQLPLPQTKTFLALPQQPIEKLLIVLVSLLVGIWLMRETIALRNILLVICTLLSIYYLYKNASELFSKRAISTKNWAPIFLIALLFLWVIVHYIFFSIEPIKQFEELTSTWLRSLMACIIGFTVGLIISNHTQTLNWIALALISGFVLLFN